MPGLAVILSVVQVAWHVQAAITDYGDRAPVIIEQPTDELVTRGQPVTLNCKAEGHPPPQISWYKDDRPLEPGPGVQRFFLHGGALYFVEVVQNKRHTDAGVYWCQANNSIGSARSRNASLDIASLRDEFRVSPLDVTVAQSERVRLKCEPPRGHPAPTVSWRRNGAPLDMAESRRLQVLPPGDLVIDDVRHHDQGTYSCVAENEAGSRESRSARLVVHVRPFFVTRPVDVNVTAGRRVELTCHVSGDPLPSITWRRLGRPLPVARVHVTDSKSLTIDSVQLQDQGEYFCRAENTVGHVTGTAKLTVTAPPKITSRTVIAESEVAEPVWLECSAEGRPRPVLYWLREGVPQPVTGQLAANGSLLLARPLPGDQGYYLCGAVSAAGSDLLAMELLLRSQPAAQLTEQLRSARQLLAQLPVVRLTARSLSAVSAQLVWTPGVGKLSASAATMHGFYVRYREARPDSQVPPDSWATVTVPDSSVSVHQLSGLRADALYQVFVSPFYGDTEGRASALVSFHTPEDVPSVAPTSVRAQVINNTNVLLHWRSPETDQLNGKLLGYRLLLWNNASSLRRDYLLNDTTAGRLLTELAPGTEYWLQLAARTGAGSGPLSPPVSFSTSYSGSDVNRSLQTAPLTQQAWFVALLAFVLFVLAAAGVAIYIRRHQQRTAGRDDDGTQTKCIQHHLQQQQQQQQLPIWVDRGWSAADCMASKNITLSSSTGVHHKLLGQQPLQQPAGSEYAELDDSSGSGGPYASTCVITANPLSVGVRPYSGYPGNVMDSGNGDYPGLVTGSGNGTYPGHSIFSGNAGYPGLVTSSGNTNYPGLSISSGVGGYPGHGTNSSGGGGYDISSGGREYPTHSTNYKGRCYKGDVPDSVSERCPSHGIISGGQGYLGNGTSSDGEAHPGHGTNSGELSQRRRPRLQDLLPPPPSEPPPPPAPQHTFDMAHSGMCSDHLGDSSSYDNHPRSEPSTRRYPRLQKQDDSDSCYGIPLVGNGLRNGNHIRLSLPKNAIIQKNINISSSISTHISERFA